MKLQELLEFAEQKKLKIHKYKVGSFIRNRYIYSDEEDILEQKLITIEKIPYTRYSYFAQTPNQKEHEMYKITAKDYRFLLKNGAIEI